MRTAFVTGARGLVGSWLVDALLARDVAVLVLERPQAGRAPDGRVSTVTGDLTGGVEPLRRALDEHGVDSVFHLAARSTGAAAAADPAGTFEVNVRGTWTVLEACRLHGVERAVVASTDRVYGAAPQTRLTEELPLLGRAVYDASKVAADLLARSAAFDAVPVAVVRTTNVYGGGDRNHSRLVPELIGAALCGRPPVIHTDGSPRRRHLYVEDAVAAYLAVADGLDAGLAGEAFNAGGDREHSVQELAEVVRELAGVELAPDVRGAPVPAPLVDRLDLDCFKLQAATGWTPRVGLREGLERTLAWYRAHPGVLTP
ncbi:MAG: NAD-dependent epimerase/dehydratase [Solirubrobacterales bacterium]|nr:NAD-dependent epimerase/dehydratase [Solirubrobacterales bacterium]